MSSILALLIIIVLHCLSKEKYTGGKWTGPPWARRYEKDKKKKKYY